MRLEGGSDQSDRIARALGAFDLDGLVCVLPSNVLLLSGYWPVVGASVAVAGRDGRVELLVPDDEADLAGRGWATAVHTYAPGSLERQLNLVEALQEPLRGLIMDAGLERKRVGFESKPVFEGSSYSATVRGLDAGRLLEGIILPASDADGALNQMRFALTAHEVDRVRMACDLARRGFEAAK